MQNSELSTEIDRLKAEFNNADESKLRALESLIEQAAYERLYLKTLNEQAMQTGLVQFHPENATIQRALPVSGEISRHAASLTNIMFKLCRLLDISDDTEDEGLEDYE